MTSDRALFATKNMWSSETLKAVKRENKQYSRVKFNSLKIWKQQAGR